MSNPILDRATEAMAAMRSRPELAVLRAAEEYVVGQTLKLAPELDPATVGAAWLILGNVFGQLASEQPDVFDPAAMVNLAQLAGQRFYSGTDLPRELRCPYVYESGAECKHTATAAADTVLDAMMAGHYATYHPGESWPPVVDELVDDAADEDAEVVIEWGVCVSCGVPQVQSVDGTVIPHVVQLPNGVRECSGSGLPAKDTVVLPGPDAALPELGVGRCKNCHAAVGTVHTEEVRLGFVTEQGLFCSRCAFERGALTLDQIRAAIGYPPLEAPRSYTLDEANAYPGGIEALTGGAIKGPYFSVEDDDEQDEDGEE